MKKKKRKGKARPKLINFADFKKRSVLVFVVSSVVLMLVSMAVSFNSDLFQEFLFNSLFIGILLILAFNLWIFLVLKVHNDEGRVFLLKLSAACLLIVFLLVGFLFLPPFIGAFLAFLILLVMFFLSAFNFDPSSKTGSVFIWLIVGLIYYFLFAFILFLTFLKINRETVKKSVLKTALFFVLFFVLALLMSLSAINIYYSKYCEHSFDSTYLNLKTNIFTRECDLGRVKSESCDSGAGPWYYKEGCDISRDKKIEVIKSSEIFGSSRFLEHCNWLCETGSLGYCDKLESNESWRYSSFRKEIHEEFSCKDLVDCGTVSCGGKKG